MALLKPETKILIVEDYKDSQRFFPQVLQRLGYRQIEVEGNGRTGVEKAREYMPHLIFMDTELPGLMGYEACRQIRAEPWGKQMAILSMSTNPFVDQQWQDAGADAFIHKDMFYRESARLDEKIQEVLAKYTF